MGEKWNAYRVSVGKPEGKRLLRRPGHRWEYNIKMHLREIGWDCMDWIHLAQDGDQSHRLLSFQVPIKCWNILKQPSY
jgi:hypothetical protein